MGRETGSPVCKTCYARDLSVPEAVLKKRVVIQAVRSLEPQLSEEQITGAIEASVDSHGGLRTLARQVTSTPEVLLGSSLSTKLIYGFVEQLLAAGAIAVSLPVCPACGKSAPIQKAGPDLRACTSCETRRADGRALCSACYVRFGPRKPCGRCGRVRRIAKKATEDTPQLCHACWWEPLAVCSRCGLEGMCNGIQKGAPLCLRCRLDDRLTALVLPDREAPEWFRPLREAILTVGNPRSGHVWVGRSPAIAVLRDRANETIPLSHEALDALPQTPSTTHLRDLLIASGALPERDPYLTRLVKKIEARAASTADPDDARTLKAFGRWGVIQPVRRKYEHRELGTITVNNVRAVVEDAAAFLAWLHRRSKSLSECSQADLDEWLATHASSRQPARTFIVFAMNKGAMPKLSLPKIVKSPPAAASDLNGRLAMAHRLLTDDGLDPADRVVGALVVIYGQRLTKVAKLSVEDIIEEGGQIFLKLGNDALLIPAPLGTFLKEVPWRRQIGIAGNLQSSSWLFPGRQAGRCQDPDYLRRRLKKIGIQYNPSRNAALSSWEARFQLW